MFVVLGRAHGSERAIYDAIEAQGQGYSLE